MVGFIHRNAGAAGILVSLSKMVGSTGCVRTPR